MGDIKWFCLCYLCIVFWAASIGFDLVAYLGSGPGTEGRRFAYTFTAALFGVPIALAAIKFIPYLLQRALDASSTKFVVVVAASQILVAGYVAGVPVVWRAFEIDQDSLIAWPVGWLGLLRYFLIMFWVPCFVAGLVRSLLAKSID